MSGEQIIRYCSVPDLCKMCFVFYLLLIIHAVSVIAAQDNIARGKPASQSSTWTDNTGTYDASKAVDGDVNTHFDHGSCSHTNEPNSGNASWHVLLDGTFLISRITIYLRDDNIDHNEAMEILVSGNTCRTLTVTDIRDSTHLITNPVTLNCTEPTEGDNVTIIMAGPYLTLCEVQVFGKKKESCHCSNGCIDFPNTSCSTPSSGPICKSPWFGSFCQMENIAFQKRATQSSTYNDTGGLYCAARAVDGNTATNFSLGSCSHTNETDTTVVKASWQVLLDDHQMFNISRIRIYLRSDAEGNNKNMTVLVNGGVCNAVSGTTLQEKVRSKLNPYNATCTQVMQGNNVTITMLGQFLALCEVQVFVCSDGWFGFDCDKQCQCLNTSEVCDKDTGYCQSGCAARKQGQRCQDCEDGYFGGNCSQQCGSCKNATHCNKSTGECPQGCKTNFQKPYCKVCVDGYYGGNCSQQCGSCKNGTHCNKSNGECPQGCKTNFQTPYCKDCEDGYFGGNCSQQCGSCENATHCNKSTGECPQGCKTNFQVPHCKDCVDGYYGGNCLQKCGSCRDGTHCNKSNGECPLGCKTNFKAPHCKDCALHYYGDNCSLTCGHCLDGSDCNKEDGTCPDQCEQGYTESLCVVAQKSNKQGPQSLTGIIVGVVIAVLSIAAVVAVLVYMRRRRNSQKAEPEDQFEESTTESSFIAVSSERTSSPSLKPTKPTKPVKPPKKQKPPADNVYENSDHYYNVLPAPVRLDRLMQYVRERVTGMGFEHEYKLLRHGLNGEHAEGKKPENKKRNRFLALFPYDASRVVLSPDGDATCDYIHASYVQGFHETSLFIAAQGPNNVTVDDFWRMIWQENVSQIVMLTRVMELNRKKCEQYWPDGTKEKKCGNILIKPLLSTVRADFTTRKFLVQHSNKPSDKRTVTQLHFTSWPDHDVPSAPALVGFWKQYRSLTSSEEDITGPVVVHCSAGVGRTGTFIALDNLFDEAESLNKVNVFACVSKMREARINMVQTVEQYRFVHESVMEAIASRGTFYTLSDFEKKFGTEVKYTRQQEMEMNKQFQSLESMKMEIPGKLASDAYLPDNISKNRNKDIVPANRVRPFLSTPVADHNDYINAVVLPSATQPLGLLATQTPLTQTVVDFWRLVYDHDCFTIVCLEDNQALYPRRNETLNIGPFRITTLQVDASRDSFTVMQLNLALREQDNTHQQIRVFKLRSQIPGPPEPFLDFVNEVGTKGSSEEHRTLVHCPDGARLCGVFCSVLNIISRLRLDKEVDIYLTIRELQCIRPQFIESYDQYKFCYGMVKEYLRDSSVYANL